MDEQLHSSYDNPLEAIADELSRALNSTSVDLNEAATDQVEAGQVSMRQSAARAVRANALHMMNRRRRWYVLTRSKPKIARLV